MPQSTIAGLLQTPRGRSSWMRHLEWSLHNVFMKMKLLAHLVCGQSSSEFFTQTLYSKIRAPWRCAIVFAELTV
jgi:hypothetical protein